MSSTPRPNHHPAVFTAHSIKVAFPLEDRSPQSRLVGAKHSQKTSAVPRRLRECFAPLLRRISVDPQVCFGKPCIRGTRIWVSLVLDLLAGGMTTQDIIAEYPQLAEEDVRAAIAYGAEMTRERYVDVPGEPLDEVQAR